MFIFSFRTLCFTGVLLVVCINKCHVVGCIPLALGSIFISFSLCKTTTTVDPLIYYLLSNLVVLFVKLFFGRSTGLVDRFGASRVKILF